MNLWKSTPNSSLRPQIEYHFMARLRLGLGYRALVFASKTNLESAPRFPEVCCIWHLTFGSTFFETLMKMDLINLLMLKSCLQPIHARPYFRKKTFFQVPKTRPGCSLHYSKNVNYSNGVALKCAPWLPHQTCNVIQKMHQVV